MAETEPQPDALPVPKDGRFRGARREDPEPSIAERRSESVRLVLLYVTKLAEAGPSAADLVSWADPAELPKLAKRCRRAVRKLKGVNAAIRARKIHAAKAT